MAITIIIHIMNADAIVAEIDELPDPQATALVCTNPRGRDGKAAREIKTGGSAALYAAFNYS